MTDFPLLDTTGIIYLDSAATTQKPRSVIEAVTRHYEAENANIHRAVYSLSVVATERYEQVRGEVARILNVPARQVIFTKGTTEAINLVAHSWGRANITAGDEILLTPLEHHANIVPWQVLARETGARLVYATLHDDFTLDVDDLKRKITSRTKLLAVTHVSNVLGVATPLSAIVPYAQARGVTVLVDGAQAVPQTRVDLARLKPDFYAFSAHKMLGPTGVGVLYLDERHLGLPPYQTGGDMIDDVTDDAAEYARGEPRRFEAGTQNLAGIAGFGAAIAYLERYGWDKLRTHEEDLLRYAWRRLHEAGVTLYGPDPERDSLVHERAATISFNVPGVHPHDVGSILDRHGVAIRTGQHCAHPLHRRLGVDATCRASFYLYNSRADVDRLVDALAKVREVFS